MHESTYRESIQKLSELIRDIRIAMLTTAMPDGTLRSRPMATQQREFDGDLWFFIDMTSAKTDEVHRSPYVNLGYAAPEKNRYVSVSGFAAVVRDPEMAHALWNPSYEAWFPKGLDDPNLALLRVNVQQAEYWDAPSNRMVALAGMVKAAVTGGHYTLEEHEKLDLAEQTAPVITGHAV
jgi:general stress protein 26